MKNDVRLMSAGAMLLILGLAMFALTSWWTQTVAPTDAASAVTLVMVFVALLFGLLGWIALIAGFVWLLVDVSFR